MKYHTKLFLVVFTLLFASTNLNNIFAENETRESYKDYDKKIVNERESEKGSKEVIVLQMMSYIYYLSWYLVKLEVKVLRDKLLLLQSL